MTSLIVFDSITGNTKLIAYAISEGLSEYGHVVIKKTDEESIIDVSIADILVIGSPTENRKPTMMMMQFINDLPNKSSNNFLFTSFDTKYNSAKWFSGSAAAWIVKRLERANFKLLIPSVSFFINRTDQNLVEYESRRADKWGKLIGEKFVAQKELEISRNKLSN